MGRVVLDLFLRLALPYIVESLVVSPALMNKDDGVISETETFTWQY